MSMDQRTRKALEASIAHWRDNVAAETWKEVSVWGSECALCAEFADDECIGCPVSDFTRQGYCYGSPWGAARRAYGKWSARLGTREDWRKAAQAELDFLISLRPSDEEAA